MTAALPLRSDAFPAFFQEVYGVAPFPWQAALAEQVVNTGRWPPVIKLPTAAGKTAVLDVAVFALAAGAATPRRIALVVDRRIVVDGAFERAEKLRKALDAPVGPVCARVADALKALAGPGAPPLMTALLRGGIYREDRWARTPTQPTILCSTVDQVGSRLLHRGYGLSPRVWSIHAGLLAHDCLMVLDEAHCSTPFLQTLRALEELRARAPQQVGIPGVVVAMSATPEAGGAEPFSLTERDLAVPALRQRLDAHKPVQQVVADNARADLQKKLQERVHELARPGETLLAVVNRVDTARALATALQTRAARGGRDGWPAEIILLTGRSRAVERAELLDEKRSRLMAGRDRAAAAGSPPLVVVATQCVEVGADLDVDAMVTEACPLDALRQRLGRVDRLGQRHAQGLASPVVVVCPRESAWDGSGEPAVDRIYGTAVAVTWHWLNSQQALAPLDGAPSVFTPLAEQAPAACNAPAKDAPVLFPEYCDLWVQTGPEPAQSPEPALFLHGPGSEVPDVQVVWRGDLDLAHPERWSDTVALCPPVVGEALPLRFAVAKRWVAGEVELDSADSDVEGAEAEGEAPREALPHGQRAVLRWRGPEHSEVLDSADDLRPGDTLVVPASYGACDRFGWNPADPGPVKDLALAARRAARRAPVLRFHPGLLPTADGTDAVPSAVRELAGSTAPLEGDAPDARQQVKDVVGRLADLWPDGGEWRKAAIQLAKDRSMSVSRAPGGTGWVVVGRAQWADEAADFSDEDDSSSRSPQPLPLEQHLKDVERWAAGFAARLKLPETLARDVALAGLLHDVGKLDPRFQAWMWGGDRVRAAREAPLAKSVRMPVNAAENTQARERAGYPRGGRHELLSVRLAEAAGDVFRSRAHDWELVLHLVASHHGHCRPFAPVVADPRPPTVQSTLFGHAFAAPAATGLERLDSGVAERFWTLVQRYGWWGLSFLEACLRLADHRASQEAMEVGHG